MTSSIARTAVLIFASRKPRSRPWLHHARAVATVVMAVLTGSVHALDGEAALPTRHFGIVGTMAGAATHSAKGFSATQVAPSWLLTAAHVAPATGLSYTNDFGSSVVAEVISFRTRAPTEAPVRGALRDDLVLVRLASPIRTPYLPQLIDDEALLRQASRGAALTLVSNNSDLSHRRMGVAQLVGIVKRTGYPLLLSLGQRVKVVAGDSGSALFLGRLGDADDSSVLLGVASSVSSTDRGQSIGIFTRIGAYRDFMDAAVAKSREKLKWVAPHG